MPPGPPTAEKPPAPPRNPLMIRVAFSGHRAATNNQTALDAQLARTFALVAEAVGWVGKKRIEVEDHTRSIAEAHAAIWWERPLQCAPEPGLNLLIGYAPGADRDAVRLWREGRHGTVHAVFPFADRNDPNRFAWTDTPENADQSLQIELPKPDDQMPIFDAVTILDGEASLAEKPPRDAHLEQSRWLVRWADLVVVIWNGKLAAGTGGTADTVALALGKGLPVVWIDESDASMPIRFLSPERLWLDAYFPEIVDALVHPDRREVQAPVASARALAEFLIPVFLPPSSLTKLEGPRGHGSFDEETATRLDYAKGDPIKPVPWSGWRKVGAYVRSHFWYFLAVLAANLWAEFYREFSRNSSAAKMEAADDRTPSTQHVGYRLIDDAFAEADRRATIYGNLHRSIQTLLLVMAVLAVFFGTVPAVRHELKPLAVEAELILLLLALLLLNLSFFANNHQRWSDTRRFAERLRALKATWPLGFDVSDDHSDPPRTWTEWQARAIRRAAGPPSGFLSAVRLRDAALVARTDKMGIVAGQASYNSVTSDGMNALHHLVHLTETRSFYFLIVALVAFLAFLKLYLKCDFLHPLACAEKLGSSNGSESSDWKTYFSGTVLMLSAVIPTICAACLAIAAKLGIEENARRSARFAAQFTEIQEALSKTDSPADAQEHLRDAARLLLADVDNWRDAAIRRRIETL